MVNIYPTVSRRNFNCVPRNLLTEAELQELKNQNVLCIPKYHQDDEDFLGLQLFFVRGESVRFFFYSVDFALRAGLPFDHWSLFGKGTPDREGCVVCATFQAAGHCYF